MDKKIIDLVKNFIMNTYEKFCNDMQDETEEKFQEILTILNK